MSDRGRICFVAPAALPYLVDVDIASAGGAELQQVLLGERLAQRGWGVTFVVADYGQGGVKERDRYRVVATYPMDGPTDAPGLARRVLGLARGMSAAAADLYVTRGGMAHALPLAVASSLLRKPLVYMGAHDRNFDPALQTGMPWAVRKGFRLAVRLARAVVVQSEHQRKLLKAYFGRDGFLLRSGYPLPPRLPEATGEYVLWVGSTSDWKRPGLFLDVGEALPQIPCVMAVAPAGGPDRVRELERRARAAPNLDFRGFVPPRRIEEVIARARILVATSAAEGFPSVFVQAWACGVPTISLDVDPDEVICRHGLGLHVSSLEQLIAAVNRLWVDEATWRQMSRAARRYAEAEHDIERIGDACSAFFESVLRGAAP